MKKLLARSASVSHVGFAREENQDSFHSDDAQGVWVVADGVGGNHGGARASQIAVESFKLIPPRYMRIGEHIVETFACASEDMRVAARHAPRLRYMATTVVALVVADGQMYVAHVGDSRCYRMRNLGRLEQMTADDSFGGNTLSKAVDTRGTHPTVKPVGAVAGDRFLLCSDGLTNFADEESIAALLRAAATPRQACEEIVRLALEGQSDERGDNVTALVLDVV